MSNALKPVQQSDSLAADAAPAPASSTFAYMIAAVAAISGLLFGFDTAVINGALLFLRKELALSTAQTELATTSLLIGCAFGAAVAGWLTDRFGRRYILFVAGWLFAASAVGAAIAHTLDVFVIARLLGGLGIGVASVLAPLYIAEISPPGIRGRLVALNQMAIVTGILVAYLVNWSLSFLGDSSWRWMFGAAVVPSVGFCLALLFVPESPRWLTEKGRVNDALRILSRIAGSAKAKEEMVDIRQSIAAESGGAISELFGSKLRRRAVIAVVLAVLQQITGINTVIYYGSILMKEMVGGQSESAALGANIIIGVVNFVATVVSLGLIDRIGRRPLLILSAAGMTISLTALGAAFRLSPPPANLIVIIILAYVAAFAVGLGPGVWVVISELFPTRIRGRAMSVATSALWVGCIAVSFTFLSLVEAVGASGAFWIYAGLSAVTVVFVWRMVPETKGRTLEEIERSLSDAASELPTEPTSLAAE